MTDLAEDRKKFEQELGQELELPSQIVEWLGDEEHGPYAKTEVTQKIWKALVSARIAAYQAGLKEARNEQKWCCDECTCGGTRRRPAAGDALVAQTICEVCFTSSWAPCPEGTKNAVRDGEGWMMCQMCAANERLVAQTPEIKNGVE